MTLVEAQARSDAHTAARAAEEAVRRDRQQLDAMVW
jgi:hypothetical protein